MPRRSGNRYDGCVEQWKVNLAISRIKAFGFPQDQWPDLLQGLVLEVADFKFDPSRAGGHSEAQVLYCLMNNRLRTALRSQRRARKRMERFVDGLGLGRLDPAHADQHPRFAAEDPVEVRIDVRQAIEALPQRQRLVCQRLMAGQSIAQIAKAMGTSWHSVGRLIAEIRQRFSQMELDAWLQN